MNCSELAETVPDIYWRSSRPSMINSSQIQNNWLIIELNVFSFFNMFDKLLSSDTNQRLCSRLPNTDFEFHVKRLYKENSFRYRSKDDDYREPGSLINGETATSARNMTL